MAYKNQKTQSSKKFHILFSINDHLINMKLLTDESQILEQS